MNRRAHPTLRDVAALAGLSVTTVSHVLNDVPDKRIALATRERVRAAAHELAYRPNQEVIASGLRPGLTTVQLPHFEMGQWAVRTLGRLIESSGDQGVEHARLPCPLVRRGSVGPAPA